MRLSIEGVCKRYGAVAALENVSFTVPERSRTAIVGPSGSGKSTLLRLIAGFEAPDAGRILLAGDVLADGPSSVPAHRRGIGVVAQDGALFPHLSVAQNIGFGLQARGAEREARIRELMDVVELERAMLGRHPHELSGGQQQRVALARALACKPRLMLLDEPFSALDTGLREATRRSTARILDAYGVACILVTHDQAEALSFADQVAILQDGRLAQVGSPRDLYLHPGDPRTAAFLGEVILLPARVENGEASCRLGRIPVAPGTADGPAEIMLRPEQVRLTLLGAEVRPFGNEGCTGRVVELAFGGTLSTIVVALDSAGEAGAGDAETAPATELRLSLTAFSIDLPRLGDRVGVTVRGVAHVFEPRAASRGRPPITSASASSGR
jgi:iron(III) transport system ATP-binding protein